MALRSQSKDTEQNFIIIMFHFVSFKNNFFGIATPKHEPITPRVRDRAPSKSIKAGPPVSTRPTLSATFHDSYGQTSPTPTPTPTPTDLHPGGCVQSRPRVRKAARKKASFDGGQRLCVLLRYLITWPTFFLCESWRTKNEDFLLKCFLEHFLSVFFIHTSFHFSSNCAENVGPRKIVWLKVECFW